jgi:exonuclease III
MDYWKRNESQRMEGWNFLKNLNPDIALLQEVKPSLEEGSTTAEELGAGYQVYFHSLPERGRGWGSVVAVKGKYDIKDYSSCFKSSYEGSPALMCFDILLPDGKWLTIINLYGANASNPFNTTRFCSTTMHYMLSDITPLVHKTYRKNPFIVLAGDFNVSTQWDATHNDPAHKLVFDRINDLGLINCTEKKYGRHVLTHVHRNSEVPWQDDYIFVTEPLYDRLVDCKVHDRESIEDMSDHLPVEIEINL